MYHTTYLYVSIDQINSTRSNIGFTEDGIHPCDGSGVCERELTHGTCMRRLWGVSVTSKCKNVAFFAHFRTESYVGIRRVLKSRNCCTGTTIVVPKEK